MSSYVNVNSIESWKRSTPEQSQADWLDYQGSRPLTNHWQLSFAWFFYTVYFIIFQKPVKLPSCPLEFDISCKILSITHLRSTYVPWSAVGFCTQLLENGHQCIFLKIFMPINFIHTHHVLSLAHIGISCVYNLWCWSHLVMSS